MTGATPGPPDPRNPVAIEEDLRRAVRPVDLDDRGRPTSAPFHTRDMSVDVASLAPLAATRARWPTRWIAITKCRWYVERGYQPEHAPLEDNMAHAIVPGRISKGKAREIANKVTLMHAPLAA